MIRVLLLADSRSFSGEDFCGAACISLVAHAELLSALAKLGIFFFVALRNVLGSSNSHFAISLYCTDSEPSTLWRWQPGSPRMLSVIAEKDAPYLSRGISALNRHHDLKGMISPVIRSPRTAEGGQGGDSERYWCGY